MRWLHQPQFVGYHMAKAKGFYAAGSRPKSDVTKAEVDLGNAELALVEAESNIEIARASLLNAMGVAETRTFEVREAYREVPADAELGAEATALAAAQEAARTAAVHDGSEADGRASGAEAAGNGALTRVRVVVDRGPRQTTATVTGSAVVVLWPRAISQTATAATERVTAP